MDRFLGARPTEDGWFRIGTFEVGTAALLAGIGVISMFVTALDGPRGGVTKLLALIARDGGPGVLGVLEGGIWRLVTWPIPNSPGFWTVILLAILFMLGTQLETRMGRIRFTWLIAILTVVPAVIATAYALIANHTGWVSGLRYLELGVLVAFAAIMPSARFWPGIPAWIIAAGIVVIEALQAIQVRDSYAFVLLASVVVVSLLAIKAFGEADELTWLPTLALPAFIGTPGSSPPRRRAGLRLGSTKSAKKSSHLRSVEPPPRQHDDALADLEINALLDKMAEGGGIDSLTPEQRKRLKEHSKRLRKRD